MSVESGEKLTQQLDFNLVVRAEASAVDLAGEGYALIPRASALRSRARGPAQPRWL